MQRLMAAVVLISILLPFQGFLGGDAWAGQAPVPERPAAPPPASQQAAEALLDDPTVSAAIAAALARVQPENQRVLIHWRSASADRSVELERLLTDDRTIARKILYEYEVVPIELEGAGQGAGLLSRSGLDAAARQEIPRLTVLDGHGQVVANLHASALTSGDELDADVLLGFLAEHQSEYLKAADVLAAALAEAERTDKLVFLHSGAPWCGWCKRLEKWMARPEMAEILAKDFVPLKIDVDRMLGAKAIGDKYVGGYGGVPWIVILDSDGELLADSFNEEGRNIGSPYHDWEVEYFGVMMRQVARNITKAEIEAMQASFVEARETSGG